MKNFSDRLDFVIEKLGGVGKACTATGMSYPTLGRWKDGSSDPKMSNMVALSQAANVSLDWLMMGTGTPDGSTPQPQSQPDPDDFYHVPYYRDIIASAGGGKFSDGVIGTDDFLAFRKDWINRTALTAKDLVALNTDGDSMLPTIPENATILVDKSKNIAKDGRIYVVRIDDRLYVKRVQWVLGGGLRLISDNSVYDSLDITRTDLEHGNIQVYGQVIHISYDLPH
ncbi:MAG: helix-turn-helix transcriptional regulator [Moraxella sp.]|nr:helix-turn-helix transcriptional regulator [Moraxella sp.]